MDVVTDHLPLSSFRHLHTHYSFLSASVLLSFSVSANLTVRLCSLVPLTWGACFLKASPPSPQCSPPSDPWQPDKVNMTGFFPLLPAFSHPLSPSVSLTPLSWATGSFRTRRAFHLQREQTRDREIVRHEQWVPGEVQRCIEVYLGVIDGVIVWCAMETKQQITHSWLIKYTFQRQAAKIRGLCWKVLCLWYCNIFIYHDIHRVLQ